MDQRLANPARPIWLPESPKPAVRSNEILHQFFPNRMVPFTPCLFIVSLQNIEWEELPKVDVISNSPFSRCCRFNPSAVDVSMISSSYNQALRSRQQPFLIVMLAVPTIIVARAIKGVNQSCTAERTLIKYISAGKLLAEWELTCRSKVFSYVKMHIEKCHTIAAYLLSRPENRR